MTTMYTCIPIHWYPPLRSFLCRKDLTLDWWVGGRYSDGQLELINTLETTLVDRPSTQVRFHSGVRDRTFWLTIPQACELSRAEMIASVPAFLDKLARYRPRFVCFVGMIIWEIVRNRLVKLLQQGIVKRMEKGKGREKSRMGLQTFKLVYEIAGGMSLRLWMEVCQCYSV